MVRNKIEKVFKIVLIKKNQWWKNVYIKLRDNTQLQQKFFINQIIVKK